jgi:hypothetical protein
VPDADAIAITAVVRLFSESANAGGGTIAPAESETLSARVRTNTARRTRAWVQATNALREQSVGDPLLVTVVTQAQQLVLEVS